MADSFDLVIRNATCVTAADTWRSDIGIRDGRIEAIGRNLGVFRFMTTTIMGDFIPALHYSTGWSSGLVTGGVLFGDLRGGGGGITGSGVGDTGSSRGMTPDPQMRPACQPPPIRDRKTESRYARYGEGFSADC